MIAILIFLLLIAPTIQYRVELGPLSFALMEPVTVLAAGLLLAGRIAKQKPLAIANDPLIWLFAGITVWAALIRPWGLDRQHGLSDVRDWAVPLLGYMALVSTARRRWRTWIGMFLAWIVLLSILGVYQHFNPSARPFLTDLATTKTGFTVSAEDETRLQFVSAAVGFFTHPNGYALYLFLGLMTALGWLESGHKRWYKAVVIALIALALFWAYAKASLIAMALAVAWFWVQHRFKRGGQALAVAGLAGLAAIPLAWIALQHSPAALLNTLRWRVQLWEIALQTIQAHPLVLLGGNGMDWFAQQAFYGQPHNVYLYLLLEYGLVGAGFTALLIIYLWRFGWRLRQGGFLRREPLLAGLWVALLGFTLIGLVESNLIGVESRMIFLWTAACFTGLAREVMDERRAESESLAACPDESANVA